MKLSKESRTSKKFIMKKSFRNDNFIAQMENLSQPLGHLITTHHLPRSIDNYENLSVYYEYPS